MRRATCGLCGARTLQYGSRPRTCDQCGLPLEVDESSANRTQREQWCLAIDGMVRGPYSRDDVQSLLLAQIRKLPQNDLLALCVQPWGNVQVTNGEAWLGISDCPVFSEAVDAAIVAELRRRSWWEPLCSRSRSTTPSPS